MTIRGSAPGPRLDTASTSVRFDGPREQWGVPSKLQQGERERSEQLERQSRDNARSRFALQPLGYVAPRPTGGEIIAAKARTDDSIIHGRGR